MTEGGLQGLVPRAVFRPWGSLLGGLSATALAPSVAERAAGCASHKHSTGRMNQTVILPGVGEKSRQKYLPAGMSWGHSSCSLGDCHGDHLRISNHLTLWLNMHASPSAFAGS